MTTARPASVAALDQAVADCRACPRLVSWREQVAKEKRAAFRDQTYWGRAVPGFGPKTALAIKEALQQAPQPEAIDMATGEVLDSI